MQIGIISGMDLKELFDKKPRQESVEICSVDVLVEIGEVEGVYAAFLNRHGKGHKYAPHEIRYKENLTAMKKLGICKVIATSSSGVINPEIGIGSIVIPDDFLLFNKPTVFATPVVAHISLDEPYCPALRGVLIEKGKEVAGNRVIEHGTYYNSSGPAFETKAEIKLVSECCDIVGMTSAKEAILARELGMCYATIATADNYACGIEGYNIKDAETGPKRTGKLVKEIIKRTVRAAAESKCSLCPNSLKDGLVLSEKKPEGYSGFRYCHKI